MYIKRIINVLSFIYKLSSKIIKSIKILNLLLFYIKSSLNQIINKSKKKNNLKKIHRLICNLQKTEA